MPTPFPPYKTFDELGLDPKRKFVVVFDRHHTFNKGDILEWVCCVDYAPVFRSISDGEEAVVYLRYLAYADEPTNSTNNLKTKCMSILEKLRNLTLKGTDKVMVDAGLESPAGKPTAEGFEAMRDFLYRKHREKLAEEVKKLLEEEEENNK